MDDLIYRKPFSAGAQAVNCAFMARQIHFTLLVLAEGSDAGYILIQQRLLPRIQLAPQQPPDAPGAVIAEKIYTLPLGQAPPVDHAASNRAVAGFVRWVRSDRQDQAALITVRRPEALEGFHDIPAIILAARAAGRLEVDFLK